MTDTITAPDTITSITVSNYKRVNEITLYPEGSTLILAGKNGNGKSSFLDAVREIFDPQGVRETSKPRRNGEGVASVKVTTSTAVIERVWKGDDAGTLTAYALDGKKHSKSGKQFILDATDGIMFDPWDFVSLDAGKQREALLKRVDLPFDLAKLDAERAQHYSDRRDVSRTVKDAAAYRAGLPTPPAGTSLVEESAADILAEHHTARAHNAEVERSRTVATNAAHTAAQAAAGVEQARLALAEYERRAAVAAAAAAEALATAHQITPVDTSTIEARLASIEVTNANVRVAQAVAAADAKLATAKAEEDTLNAAIDAIDKTKSDGLKAAVFPVPGLSVDDTGITFNGAPFKQVNPAMQAEIAADLATSTQPSLRLIIIKNGDLMDADTLQRIVAKLESRGYLAMIERDRDRADSEKVGIVAVVNDGYLEGGPRTAPVTPLLDDELQALVEANA